MAERKKIVNAAIKVPDTHPQSTFNTVFSDVELRPDGRIACTMTVTLNRHSFNIQAEDKHLSATKENRYDCGESTRSTPNYMQRQLNCLNKLRILSAVFPEAWGLDFNAQKMDQASCPAPNDVPWARSTYHPCSKKPERKRVRGRHLQGSTTPPEADDAYDATVLAWEQLNETAPKDVRRAPSWVSRRLVGSAGTGNGGYAALGIQGCDLATDLVSSCACNEATKRRSDAHH
jgi:hypothetical protein